MNCMLPSRQFGGLEGVEAGGLEREAEVESPLSDRERAFRVDRPERGCRETDFTSRRIRSVSKAAG